MTSKLKKSNYNVIGYFSTLTDLVGFNNRNFVFCGLAQKFSDVSKTLRCRKKTCETIKVDETSKNWKRKLFYFIWKTSASHLFGSIPKPEWFCFCRRAEVGLAWSKPSDTFPIQSTPKRRIRLFNVNKTGLTYFWTSKK